MSDSSRDELSPPLQDIAANRRAQKWSRQALIGRILWAFVRPVFALSPRPLWGLRNSILRLFGAKIAANVHVYPSVKITIPWNLDIGAETAIGDGAILYALGPITIGQQATISQGAHLCAGTHDYREADMPLIKAPITIGDGAWICADAFIGPGRKIGNRAIVAARGVVVKDIPDSVIVGGNPATFIAPRQEP
ncbi:hypothetical protein [Parvularcula marina]|uniref:Acetyltransferase n=1 Tax=Parvularcula marina TaxID=2292771 RepID=A0A371RGA8_9PROT|nr:hypothetical protein [Parvularcula marina]RFB04504.1 hypothetical protein DX908_03895 [Parvularcula marina]